MLLKHRRSKIITPGMPAHRAVTGTPAENVPPAAQLILKGLGILEDFPLQGRIEGLGQSVVSAGAD